MLPRRKHHAHPVNARQSSLDLKSPGAPLPGDLLCEISVRPSRIPDVLPSRKASASRRCAISAGCSAKCGSTSPGLMSGTHRAAPHRRRAAAAGAALHQIHHRRGGAPDGCPRPGPSADWIATGRLNLMGLLLLGEFALVFGRDLLQRGIQVVDALQGELHSNRVSIELMRHAAELDLKHFEDPPIRTGWSGPAARPRAARPCCSRSSARGSDHHRHRPRRRASCSMRRC